MKSSTPEGGIQQPGPQATGPVVGVALGSGAARGWAHVGVLLALQRIGIEPWVVAGTSMGALIGAAYVAGNLEALHEWALGLHRIQILRLIDLRLTGGGLVEGTRLMEFLRAFIPETPIEELPKPFAAVGTDMGTGREVWFREGSLADAVRASIAIPGLFSPVDHDGHLLLDGGLVNPVPVALCRALGAQVVIAVNPNGNLTVRAPIRTAGPLPDDPKVEAEILEEIRPGLRRQLRFLISRFRGKGPAQPGMMEVLTAALNIMQDRIVRSRMAGDPPEVELTPRMAHLALMDFHRAAEAIAEGEACVERMKPVLLNAMEG